MDPKDYDYLMVDLDPKGFCHFAIDGFFSEDVHLQSGDVFFMVMLTMPIKTNSGKKSESPKITYKFQVGEKNKGPGVV